MSNADVLIVDEDRSIAEYCRNAVQKFSPGCRVFCMKNPDAARDFLLGQGAYADRNVLANPRVVLTEIKFQKSDGAAFIRALKSDIHLKRIPLVVLTSSTSERDVAECYQSGGNSYVIKPDSSEEFEKLLAQLVRYWLCVSRSPN